MNLDTLRHMTDVLYNLILTPLHVVLLPAANQISCISLLLIFQLTQDTVLCTVYDVILEGSRGQSVRH